MIDVEFLLKFSDVKNKRVCNKAYVKQYVSEMNKIYKNEKEEKKEEEKENKNTKFEFTLSDRFSGGVRPIKAAINHIRAFCYKEGFEIKVYENYGWLFGSAEFVIKGNATKSYIKEIERAYKEWVKKFFDQY